MGQNHLDSLDAIYTQNERVQIISVKSYLTKILTLRSRQSQVLKHSTIRSLVLNLVPKSSIFWFFMHMKYNMQNCKCVVFYNYLIVWCTCFQIPLCVILIMPLLLFSGLCCSKKRRHGKQKSKKVSLTQRFKPNREWKSIVFANA